MVWVEFLWWATFFSLASLFAYFSRRQGLGRELPPDAGGRAAFWANQHLQMLKSRLRQAVILRVEPDHLQFEGTQGQGRLCCRDGRLSLHMDGYAEQLLSHSEETVILTFERVGPTALLAQLQVNVPPDGARQLGLRLEVAFRD